MSLDATPGVISWFAFLHDSQRHNDRRDPQHGQRAADFALRLRRDVVISELSDSEFEHLCEAMRLHSDGRTEGDPAILACWDADRLDFARVGIEPDPSRLCIEPVRQPQTISAAVRLAIGERRAGTST